MKRLSTMNAVRITLVAVMLLAATATPALAVGRPSVPNHATFWGKDLYGMSEASAAAEIQGAFNRLQPLTIKYGSKTWKFNPRYVATLYLDKTVAKAYASVPTDAPYAITPVYTINAVKMRAWVAAVSKQVNKAPVNSAYVLYKGSSIRIQKPYNGIQMRTSRCGDSLLAALYAQMATGQPRTVVFTTVPVAPRITQKNLGKLLLVRLSQRHLWLFNPAGLEKDYRIAIGTSSHPTPKGIWKIVGKVKNPSWTNPGSAWARSMPSYIPPGPSNPLGTRALYLSAAGIRIHGTNNVNSVGTAASHGCMRMVRKDVENLYPRVPIGAPVWIVK